MSNKITPGQPAAKNNRTASHAPAPHIRTHKAGRIATPQVPATVQDKNTPITQQKHHTVSLFHNTLSKELKALKDSKGKVGQAIKKFQKEVTKHNWLQSKSSPENILGDFKNILKSLKQKGELAGKYDIKQAVQEVYEGKPPGYYLQQQTARRPEMKADREEINIGRSEALQEMNSVPYKEVEKFLKHVENKISKLNQRGVPVRRFWKLRRHDEQPSQKVINAQHFQKAVESELSKNPRVSQKTLSDLKRIFNTIINQRANEAYAGKRIQAFTEEYYDVRYLGQTSYNRSGYYNQSIEEDVREAFKIEEEGREAFKNKSS